MDRIKVKIVNKSNNTIPHYETLMSAGMDVRAYITPETSNAGNNTYILNPGARAMIHTGLYIQLPEGYEMQVRARSGLAIKNGINLINGTGTIDADYTGECNVLLHNNSDTSFEIRNGDRIAQWILNEVPKAEFEIVDKLEETDRGAGGFGSTGV